MMDLDRCRAWVAAEHDRCGGTAGGEPVCSTCYWAGEMLREVDTLRLDLIAATACIVALLDQPTVADIGRARSLLADLQGKELGGR